MAGVTPEIVPSGFTPPPNRQPASPLILVYRAVPKCESDCIMRERLTRRHEPSDRKVDGRNDQHSR